MFKNTWIIRCILFLMVLLLGYALGRRSGIKEGREEGIRIAPLIMRENLLKASHCPLCERSLKEGEIYDNIPPGE